jgi:hypothetical protein
LENLEDVDTLILCSSVAGFQMRHYLEVRKEINELLQVRWAWP